MCVKASAPGSLMLLGEYGVLYGKHALVCAVDKRMSVKLIPREDKKILIQSTLGTHETTVSTLKVCAPFQFVLTTLKQFQKKLSHGCELIIDSEFSDKMGFASSAAVTVATFAALSKWLHIPLTPYELVEKARAVVRKVQGVGSGADVAACVFGGMVGYRAKPIWIEKFDTICPISVIYSGHKTPTVDAITRVQKNFSALPNLFQQTLRSIDECAKEGIQCVKKQNWLGLGNIMNIQQGLMEALGVNTLLLNALIQDLRADSSVHGAKISGSGLGDCVVALGTIANTFQVPFLEHGTKHIPVAMTNQGVWCEKI